MKRLIATFALLALHAPGALAQERVNGTSLASAKALQEASTELVQWGGWGGGFFRPSPTVEVDIFGRRRFFRRARVQIIIRSQFPSYGGWSNGGWGPGWGGGWGPSWGGSFQSSFSSNGYSFGGFPSAGGFASGGGFCPSGG